MLQRNIERKRDSEGNNITYKWKLKEIRARSQEKKGEKKKLIKMYNLYLLLLLWLLSSTEKNNLIDLLQHPVVSMFIAIRFPIHNSPKDTISIALFLINQRHHNIIMYIPKQQYAVPFASNIQHYESFISRRGLILVVYTLHQNNTYNNSQQCSIQQSTSFILTWWATHNRLFCI